MLAKLTRGTSHLILLAATVAVIGCAGAIDETRIEEIEQELIDMDLSISAIKQSVQDLSDQIEEVTTWIKTGSQETGLSQEAAQQIALLEKKTVEFETKLNDANSKISAMSSRLKTVEQKAGAQSGPSYSSGDTAKPSSTAAAPPKVEQPVSVGYHYPVEEGETVETIAQKLGVSAGSIRKANPALSGTGQPVSNTLIWIPGARKD
jgi:LysM repeat protein